MKWDKKDYEAWQEGFEFYVYVARSYDKEGKEITESSLYTKTDSAAERIGKMYKYVLS